MLVLPSAAPVCATIVVKIDKLDPSDDLPMPPSHLVVVDLAVSVSADDAFSMAGIVGAPLSGARLVYAYADGLVVPTVPGVENRFVTFFSSPRPRDEDERFDESGRAYIGGRYCGQAPPPILIPTNVNAFAFDVPVAPEGIAGYVLRVVIDVSGVTHPPFRMDSANIVLSASPPIGSVALFETSCSETYPPAGTLISSRDFQEIFFEFGIYGVLLGDLDGDGDVDLNDLTALLANFGTQTGAEYADGDLDGDRDVDLRDLVLLLANFGPPSP